jgi:hypothetical protein
MTTTRIRPGASGRSVVAEIELDGPDFWALATLADTKNITLAQLLTESAMQLAIEARPKRRGRGRPKSVVSIDSQRKKRIKVGPTAKQIARTARNFAILAMLDEKTPVSVIAAKFKVTTQTVYNVRNDRDQKAA